LLLSQNSSDNHPNSPEADEEHCHTALTYIGTVLQTATTPDCISLDRSDSEHNQPVPQLESSSTPACLSLARPDLKSLFTPFRPDPRAPCRNLVFAKADLDQSPKPEMPSVSKTDLGPHTSHNMARTKEKITDTPCSVISSRIKIQPNDSALCGMYSYDAHCFASLKQFICCIYCISSFRALWLY